MQDLPATRSHLRHVQRILIAVSLAVAVALVGYGAADAALPGLSLQSGQTASVSCSGGSLSVTPQSATNISVTCNPSPTTPTTPPPAKGWWSIPTGVVSWQWVLNHPFNVNNPSDMGTNDYLPSGSPAPAPTVYDNYYSAAQEGITTSYYDQLQAAGVLGNTLPGYPQERFLNINSPAAVSIIESMISQQCAAKGFDAVETDLDETYTGYDGSTGFPLTKSNEQTFLTALANDIHGQGLGWIAKNLVDTGDSFATTMEPLADGLLTENCNQWNQCGQSSAYISNGKGVLNAEYNLNTSQFCPADDAAGINGAHIDSSVDGFRQPCR